MTARQINSFKTILKAKQAELRPSILGRDVIAIERTADALDQVQLASERELATRNLERESKLSRSVRAALDRIDEGTYGACLNCDEDIGMKRLHAVPWASLCIGCQEEADKAGDLDHREILLRKAA